jgi:hypothetical protein
MLGVARETYPAKARYRRNLKHKRQCDVSKAGAKAAYQRVLFMPEEIPGSRIRPTLVGRRPLIDRATMLFFIIRRGVLNYFPPA